MNEIKLLLLIGISGFLWAFGGAEGTSKNWRRIGIPILIALARWNLWGLALHFPLIMGYGIPCHNDEGSIIGRFFYKLTNKNEYLASIYTRIFMGILYGLFIGIITWNLWPVVILGTIVPLFGAVIQTEPQIRIFGKVLNTEEMIIGAFIGLSACL